MDDDICPPARNRIKDGGITRKMSLWRTRPQKRAMTGSSSVSTSPPQGAPPSKLLFEILKLLVSEREASLIALVPIRPFTVETASRAWRMSVPEAQNALEI